MKSKNIIAPAKGVYEAPMCELVEVKSEGVLCGSDRTGSFESAYKNDGTYQW